MSRLAVLNTLSSTFVILFSPFQDFCGPNIKISVYKKKWCKLDDKEVIQLAILFNFTKSKCIAINQSLQMYIATKENDFMLGLDPISFGRQHQSLILH